MNTLYQTNVYFPSTHIQTNHNDYMIISYFHKFRRINAGLLLKPIAFRTLHNRHCNAQIKRAHLRCKNETKAYQENQTGIAVKV